jgi:ABC-type taurine transport system substrate-binding protein
MSQKTRQADQRRMARNAITRAAARERGDIDATFIWDPLLGKMVYNASNFLRTDVVTLGTLAIGFVAYVFELPMRWIEKGAVP